LIFGSIAVFEYRENIFATGLFKSFGFHSIYSIMKYLIESLFLLFLSFWSALELVKVFHRIVFKLAGFDLEFLNLATLNPYQFSENFFFCPF
jgi:ABC-type Co2+ transport system permease subunit